MSNRPNTAHIVAFPESEVSLLDAYLRGLPSPNTRKVYRQVLAAFDEFLGDEKMVSATRRAVEAYRAHQEDMGRAPATIAKHLSAISGYLRYAVDEGVIDRNPATSARRPPLPDVSPRKALSMAEAQALVDAVERDTLVGLRDLAMLITLTTQGWRISELLALRVEDLDEEAGHKVATVRGKGGRVDRVPLAAATWTVLTTWCMAASIEVGPIFVAVDRKCGTSIVPGKPLSQQAAWKRLRLLAKRAGIRRAVHAHLFRHWTITQLLAAGVALHLVQDFARHADPRTTRMYDARRRSLDNPGAHVLAAKLDLGVVPGADGAEPQV